MRDYKSDLKVNINQLEDEWLTQPSKYMYYAEALADAQLLKDEQKQRLEVCDAELDEQYRNKWDELYPDIKMTEAGVRSKILQDTNHKKQQTLLNTITKNVNVLTSAKTAFEHRKKALENLVTLKVTGFHAEPRMKKIRVQEEVRTEQKKALAKSRRRKRD